MREILFKAKRIDNNEWVDGFPVFYRGGQVGIAQIHVTTRINCVEGNDYFNIKDLFCPKVKCETVSQFTGLTDANGIKIFEGDILKVSSELGSEFGDDCYCAVKFTNGYFDSGAYQFIGWCLVGNSWKHSKALSEWLIKEYSAEVVGNVFDNPELLVTNE